MGQILGIVIPGLTHMDQIAKVACTRLSVFIEVAGENRRRCRRIGRPFGNRALARIAASDENITAVDASGISAGAGGIVIGSSRQEEYVSGLILGYLVIFCRSGVILENVIHGNCLFPRRTVVARGA